MNLHAPASRLLGMAIPLLLCNCAGVTAGAAKHMDVASPPAVVTVAAPGASPPAAVQAALEAAVAKGAPGVTAIVMRQGDALFRLDVGPIAHDAQLPVASASKWMTTALIMTVVDEGKLSLDAPISRYLPEFQGPAATTTLRELLAQTSGEGSIQAAVDIRQDARMTLGESAAAVARRPLVDPPGTVFKYGGPSFQVAGAAVEAVTGERWAQLFKQRIADPLGMSHTYWTHVPARGVSPADTLNPLLQGGVITTADDYMRFLRMLAQDGRVGDRRILSAQAIDAMETVQTLGTPMAYVPPGGEHGVHSDGAQYALGNWCETWNARHQCLLVSSPGAFGTYPWIDRQSGLYGIFFTRTRLPKVVDQFTAARKAIIGAYAPRQVAGEASHPQ